MDVVRDNHSAGYRNYLNLVNSTILDLADRANHDAALYRHCRFTGMGHTSFV